MAFVLVQHLDPKHESKLSELLARATPMPLVEATEGMVVEPDHVYVIPRNTNMTIAQGVLHLTPRGEVGPHLPLDHFFRSLARDQQSSAIGVILSGTGTDGTLGVEEIKGVGGITFAQDEQSAKFSGMSQSAVHSGCVDVILPPEEIARELVRLGRHPYVASPQAAAAAGPAPVAEEQQFTKIVALLRSSLGVDFTHYRDTTVSRRIMRRMVLRSQPSLADYARLLEQDRAEIEALYEDLLINVTGFFREPETFEALKTSVFPEIVKANGPSVPLRIWVPGCSSGQEAYSIAITACEFLDGHVVRPPIQIFASDISDSVSLAKARVGFYPENIASEVSRERLRRFFTKEEGGYRINKSLRDLCVFARQNVAGDPPFSRLDLISCRNLLIYLLPALQEKILPTFHFALNPTGFLVLGSSETVGAFSDLFAVVDYKHRIYAKKTTAVRQYPYFTVAAVGAGLRAGEKAIATSPAAADWQREADRLALSHYAPPAVLVDETLKILQFRGQTGRYLEPAPGDASFNLLKMAREGLFVELRSALDECRSEHVEVRRRAVPVREAGQIRAIDLRVVPVKLPGSTARCFLVLFEEAGSGAGPELANSAGDAGRVSSATSRNSSAVKPIPTRRSWTRRVSRWLMPAGGPNAAPTGESASASSESEVARLRQELAATREYAQSAIEQQEVASEELKSAHEEVLSSNEELQSTNEELETAKEELQSLNEELTTVNEQLLKGNLVLNQLNDDLVNFLASTNIPIIMVGVDLRIRRVTPLAAGILNVLPADVGRSIGDVKLSVDLPDLEKWLTEVMNTVRVHEQEIRDRRGRWYIMRVHPYWTADRKIDGVVAMLLDIDEIKRAEEEIREARDYASAIVATARGPLVVLDGAFRVQSANQAFYQAFRVSSRETEGEFLYSLGNHQWDIPGLRKLLEEILPTDQSFEGFEVTCNFPDIGHRVMVLNARRLVQKEGATERILLAIEDVTQRKEDEAHRRHQFLLEHSRDAIIVRDAAKTVTFWNRGAEETYGWSKDEARGQGTDTLPQTFLPSTSPDIDAALRESGLWEGELRQTRRDGTQIVVESRQVLLRDEQGAVVATLEINRDMTERRRLEDQARRLVTELSEADRSKNEFLAMLAHELRNPLAPIASALQILQRTDAGDASNERAKQVMARQMHKMVRIIDDLLDVSRISRGKIDLQKERVELAEVVTSAVETSQPLIDAAGQELTVSLPPDLTYLDADRTRLAQVFSNLLTNAAKYTARGGRIWLSVEREGREAVVRVRDTGIGIGPDMLPRVFDMFMQVDHSYERAHAGLGIGLTLVRTIVQLHGGSVQADSAGLGQGSEFTVRLPVTSRESKERTSRLPRATGEAAAPVPTRRILVVDDNVDAAEMVGMQLTLMGHEVRIVCDTFAALEAARSFRPEIVFLDIGLPGMNGYEVARRLRSELGAETPVLVALTGFDREEDRRRSREAGLEYHLVKPVEPGALEQLVATLESGDAQRRNQAT